jgi:hypothetical protein
MFPQERLCRHYERTVIMADTPIDPFPYESLERLEATIARLRYIVIAVVIVMLAGFAFLGVQVGRLNGHIDQVVTKVDGLDAALWVKFEAVNAKFDAISQRLAVELKTMGAEITAQTKAIAKSVNASPLVPAQPVPAPAQSAPAPVQPKPTPPSKNRP